MKDLNGHIVAEQLYGKPKRKRKPRIKRKRVEKVSVISNLKKEEIDKL